MFTFEERAPFHTSTLLICKENSPQFIDLPDRARFNTRAQQDGESVEDFVTALHTLSNHCEYGTLREKLVRDRLVVSIQDQKLSARLQLDAGLTLQKAVESIRQVEGI